MTLQPGGVEILDVCHSSVTLARLLRGQREHRHHVVVDESVEADGVLVELLEGAMPVGGRLRRAS